MSTDADLGKALRAWQAYNHKEKKDRPAFHLERWLKVVRILNGGTHYKAKLTKRGWHMKKGWTDDRRQKFRATMAKKRLARGT